MIELHQFTDPELNDFPGNLDAADEAAGRDVDLIFAPETDAARSANEDGWPMGLEMPVYLMPLGAASVNPMAELESGMGEIFSVVDRHRADTGANNLSSHNEAGHSVVQTGDDGTAEVPTAGGSGGVVKPPNVPTPPTGGEPSGNEGEDGERDETQSPQTSSNKELVVTFDLGGEVLSSELNGVNLAIPDAEPAAGEPLGVVRDVGSTLPANERAELLTRRRSGRTPPRVTVSEDVLERVVDGLRRSTAGQDDSSAKRYVYVPEVTPEDIAAANGDPCLALARKAEKIDSKNKSDSTIS